MNNTKENERILNKKGITLMLDWFNLLGETKDKVVSLKDFSNGIHFYNLIRFTIKNLALVETTSVGHRFQIINQTLEFKAKLKFNDHSNNASLSNVNISPNKTVNTLHIEKNDDDFQLAKLLFAVIYLLYTEKTQKVIEAVDKLTTDQKMFLGLVDTKYNFNIPKALNFYVQHLTTQSNTSIINSNERRSVKMEKTQLNDTSEPTTSSVASDRLKLFEEHMNELKANFQKETDELQLSRSKYDDIKKAYELLKKRNNEVVNNNKTLKEESENSRKKLEAYSVEDKKIKLKLKKVVEDDKLKSSAIRMLTDENLKFKNTIEILMSELVTANQENENSKAGILIFKKDNENLRNLLKDSRLSSENSIKEVGLKSKEIVTINTDLKSKEQMINKLETFIANLEAENKAEELKFTKQIDDLKMVITAQVEDLKIKEVKIMNLQDHDIELQESVRKFEVQKEIHIKNLSGQINFFRSKNEKSESDFKQIIQFINKRTSNDMAFDDNENCNDNSNKKMRTN